MSSPSSRSRIDQFFTSRKKRPSSAKDATPDKASRSTPEVSPSAKGTLDGFLVKPTAAAGPVKRNLTVEIGLDPTARKPDSHPVNNAVLANPVGIEAREPPSEPRGGNTELRRFASDFLSLYCSDLPSAENIPAEQELKGQKRNVSPSLVVAHSKACVKKQCIAEQSNSMMGAESTSCSKDCCELMEPDTIQPMELGESNGKTCMSLRRCTVTPTSGLIKSRIGVPRCGIGTPKSSSRNSLFSPGEEFWNEAIQVADGLLDVVDKLPEGLTFLKSGQASNKLLNDKLSNHCFDQKTKVIDKTSSAVQSNKESLLPVKHFDFSHEECNGNTEISSLQRIMGKSEAVRNAGIGLADSSSVNKKRMQTSNVLVRCQAQSSSQNLCEKMDSSINEPVDMKADSISDKQLNKNLPSLLDEKSPQTVELPSDLAVADTNAGVLTKKDVLTHVQKDRDLSAPSHNPENVEKGIKYNPSPSDNFDEAGTMSSSMQLKARLQLSSWLPPEVCNMYTKKGISQLYPWQVDCLLVEGVLEKRNLVYCASTSAGKSFVAEVLMLRRIISTGKMALLVLPYVSICAEKAEHLEVLLEPLGKHVRSFYGNQGGGSLPKDTSVAVCTIEKANSLINRLLEEGRLSEVGIIVIDELHMVGDQHRGYLLELMLTKLRYAAGEGNSESSSGESSGTSSGKTDPAHGLQMVGMSATMPNIASVADWLQAALYQTDFRPVPLEEYIKIGNTIFDKKLDVVRTLPRTADLGGKDPDHIVELCNEVVQEGHSVLLFCSSRKGCESTAKHVSKFLKKMSISLREAASEFNDASSAIEALRRCPAGLDPILEETLPSGVAYHHAGLTVEEREIIETCYRKGIVRVLTATSTLAAGVNLPARRVIFRQPRIGRDFIDGTRYKQMSGRAGRTGIDTKGESILVCKPDEAKRIISILNDCCPSLQSCLSEDKNGMTHAILEVIAGGIVQTASDIHRYVRCTLLNSTKPFQDVVKSAQDSLRWLCHKKFLEWNEETKLYSTTALGRAAFGSSLTPEESLVVLADLSRAREGFILASDLHIVYLVTPINVEVEPDWELYYERFMQLSALDQSVGNRVGVLEPFLMRMAHGAPVPTRDKSRGKSSASHDKLQAKNASDENGQILRVSKRFYVALMLSRLVQEIPVADVCEAFKVARGMIQALQENAGRFASMVSQFCERLGWRDMEGLVSKFQNRVSFGVRAEIAELTTIQYVKGSRARALYKAGLRTPAAIAEASIPEIAKALFDASAWAGQEGGAMRRMQMGIAKKIKNGARKIIFEQAEEARLVAFSAFKSLGVNVTNLSRPIVSANLEDSFTRGGGLASSGEDAHSGNTRCGKASQLSSSPPVGDKNMQCDDIPQDFEKPIRTAAGHVDCVGEERTTMDTEMVVEASSAFCDPPGNLPNNDIAGTSRERYNPELTASYTNAVRGERLVPGGIAPNTGIFSSSDKGPINASSIPGGFDSFLNQWDAVSEFYFDVHFSKRSDLNSPILFEVFGLAVCWEHSPVYYVNISKDLFASGKFICDDATRSSASELTPSPALSDVWEVAKSRWDRITMIIARKGVRKFTWNLKIQIQVLKVPCISVQRFGRLSVEQKEQSGFEFIDNSYIMLPSIFVHDGIDMCLVAWILWPDEESKTTPSLEKVVKKRLSSVDAAAAIRDGRWRNQMHRAAHNGCCRRAAQTRALGFVFWKLLVSEDLVEALTGIENPLVQVLADMELWGIGVDMEACLQARHILVGKLKELEKEAYGLAGMTFSLFTAADIANVLYTRLKLPVPQSCKKGKQHPSTDKHSLDLLRGQHPIISVIKEHRTLAKLLNSTLGSICSRAQLCIKSQKYIIRGHWLQTSTATGRLSMEEPNLQCVEHSVLFTTRDKKNSGPSDLDHHEINARDLFIPTQDNWLLLTADYSQIELRLMAHYSKDSSLVELLRKPDGDVFTMLAARWMHKTETAISSQEREQTKRLVYGILYGMGSNSLAEQLECSSDEAAEKIQSFKTSFPGVSSWLNEAVVACRHKGYIKTLMGRKRYLSNIKFGNNKEKAKAQRQAVNSICQGSAADIIKLAMVNLYSMIGEGNVGPSTEVGHATKYSMLKGRCRILLQVHDELVLEVDSQLQREAGMLLQTCMENAVSLLVPLHVKMKIGRTWGSLEPFQVDP